jgi:hypothetical protein
VVVIVSEETGIISIAENGVLHRGFNYQKLHDYLTQAIMPMQNKKGKKENKKKLPAGEIEETAVDYDK